jgi:hypothetical protein
MIRLYPPPPARCCPHPENDAAGKAALMITLPLPLPLPRVFFCCCCVCLTNRERQAGRGRLLVFTTTPMETSNGATGAGETVQALKRMGHTSASSSSARWLAGCVCVCQTPTTGTEFGVCPEFSWRQRADGPVPFY